MDERLLMVVERWFLLSPEPTMIVDDRNLEVLGANRAAETMLQNSSFITTNTGKLHFADPRLSDDFRHQVRVHAPDAAVICLRREDEGDFLVARVEHLFPDDQSHIATVTFQGQLSGGEVGVGKALWASLCKAFGLTPAEERVAKLLTSGDSIGMIAHRLSITVDTIRSHIQKVYIKVGVANREQLTTRLAPFHFAAPFVGGGATADQPAE